MALALVALQGSARADSNDLTLERIVGMPTSTNPVEISDVGRQTMYKSLISELGVVMAPRFLAPADTLGYSGFQVAFETGFTQIRNDADYWKRGVEKVSGSFLETISVMARKGIWLPLPSFEIGAGATKLIGANMFALQVYAKLALHEGFQKWALPSFAVRGAASRVAGAPQVDLTMVGVDASLSKSHGMGGTSKIDWYVGAAVLLTFVRSQVIDATPNIDAYKLGAGSLDLNANTTFPDPGTITRWRFFTGFRLQYAFLALTAELVYNFCNDTATDCMRASPTQVKDLSDHQAQINLSGSLIF